MSEYEVTVSLRIRHPTIDPATITGRLGVEPQHTWSAGQPRCDPGGAELGGAYRDSYWMGRLMAEPQLSSDGVSVEAAILRILNNLRRAQSFLAQLNAEGGVAELLVSLYAREDFRLDLPSDSLTLLGRLHLTVVLDVHLNSSLKAPVSRAN
jgi:Domain of unknown function (DUF4279)